MNIDLGVIDSPGRAVLVDDVIAVDHVTAPALALPGEIAADVFDVPAGNVHAVQLVECRRGGFDEVQGVVAEFATGLFLLRIWLATSPPSISRHRSLCPTPHTARDPAPRV